MSDYYCDETRCQLCGYGSEDTADVTQLVFVTRGTEERDAMFKCVLQPPLPPFKAPARFEALARL